MTYFVNNENGKIYRPKKQSETTNPTLYNSPRDNAPQPIDIRPIRKLETNLQTTLNYINGDVHPALKNFILESNPNK